MNRLLTKEENRRFCLWLQNEMESSKGMIEQFEQLPHAAPLIQREKQYVAACYIVFQKLDSSELVEVKGNESL